MTLDELMRLEALLKMFADTECDDDAGTTPLVFEATDIVVAEVGMLVMARRES